MKHHVPVTWWQFFHTFCFCCLMNETQNQWKETQGALPWPKINPTMPLSLFNIFKQHIEFHAFQEFSERGHVTPLTKVFFMNKTEKLCLQMSGTKHCTPAAQSLWVFADLLPLSATHRSGIWTTGTRQESDSANSFCSGSVLTQRYRCSINRTWSSNLQTEEQSDDDDGDDEGGGGGI